MTLEKVVESKNCKIEKVDFSAINGSEATDQKVETDIPVSRKFRNKPVLIKNCLLWFR